MKRINEMVLLFLVLLTILLEDARPAAGFAGPGSAAREEVQETAEFLWKHKYKLGAGYTFYKLMEDCGPAVNAEPGGGVVGGAASDPGNFVQGVVLSTWEAILKNSPWLMPGITAMALWLLWKLFATLIGVLNWARGIIPEPRDAGTAPAPESAAPSVKGPPRLKQA